MPGPDRALRAALDISRVLGDSRVITDPDQLERFGGDESEEPPRVPDAAILPRTASEAARCLSIASEHGVPVTPRAGGTGKTGGAVPVEGGLVLACEKMNRIKEIDAGDLVAVVEPGVILADLHCAVEDQGLFYPPDPASLDSCCLGGNVAENAGGPRAFKYGVTGHYVLRLDVALPSGAILRCGHRPVKGVAGYDLAGLFTGSEGTLGLFTEITLRLIPRPRQVSTVLALFPGLADAGRGIQAVLAAGLVPRVLEIMDRECVDTVRDGGVPLPPGIEALVLTELDGSEAAVAGDLERAGETLTRAGAQDVLVATGTVERDRLWRARRELSEALRSRKAHKISDDVAVPRSRLVAVLERIESIGLAHGLVSATYGHAGDGNLHVTFLWDDPGLEAGAAAAREEVMRLALEMDGTVSGEHGIGSVNRRYLEMELGREAMALTRGLKKLLDPASILNPGKIL
ncbi:MAG: FAD-binding protein [Deltaproteobacteria bacterium]|nr:FAD-binding protein [Deltaproteobacteria bacterium]